MRLGRGSRLQARARPAGRGAFDEAVKLFKSSATLKGAEIVPIDYRKGIDLQQAGRNDAARLASKSFVANGKGQKSSLEDARKRLEQLGG